MTLLEMACKLPILQAYAESEGSTMWSAWFACLAILLMAIRFAEVGKCKAALEAVHRAERTRNAGSIR